MKQLSTGTGLAIFAVSIPIVAHTITGQGTTVTAHAATVMPTGVLNSAMAP